VSFDYCLDDGAVLVFGPGDENDPATAVLDPLSSEAPTRIQTDSSTAGTTGPTRKRTMTIIACIAAIVIAAVGFAAYRILSGRSVLPSSLSSTNQQSIRSLAVLPLKPLDASENYIGLGLADAIIRRMSQTGQLTVRPTSAIRKYLNDETDALTAARELSVDAVLEGNIQRSNERLRVSVNLLRTSDGASLWNDSFELKTTDIFAIQDTVSQQVASRLNLKLDPTQQAGLTKQYTSDPIAYEYYQKAMYLYDERMDEDPQKFQQTIDLLKKAIDKDPNYALAHAQLANVYAEMATFIEPNEPKWAKLVEVESDTAQKLDPNIAEIHLARSLLLWSSYGGFQTKASIREVLAAQQLNPNVGHAELAAIGAHVGLTDLADRELKRAGDVDPTSEFVKNQIITRYWLLGDYDQWLVENRRLYGDAAGNPEYEMWYLLGKRRLDDAQKRMAEISDKAAGNPDFLNNKIVYLALKGDFQAAEELIPTLLSAHPIHNPNYHHATFNIAVIYALEGKSAEAVKWLQTTADSGYPCYPRFEKDPYFDRIRQTPEFVEFMARMKTEWDTYNSEFSAS
jgi:serine/threonine-protein kinase